MSFFHISQEQVNNFIKPGSFVPVARPQSSKDTIWFIQVLETNLLSTKVSKDDYQFEIPKGILHLLGHFLKLQEKKSNLKSNVFMLKTDKKAYFYMESIVYPYVKISEGPGKYFSLIMNDYTNALYFIENNEFAHL